MLPWFLGFRLENFIILASMLKKRFTCNWGLSSLVLFIHCSAGCMFLRCKTILTYGILHRWFNFLLGGNCIN